MSDAGRRRATPRELLTLAYLGLRTLAGRRRFLRRLTRSPRELAPVRAWVEAPCLAEDSGLVRRLTAAYRLAAPAVPEREGSLWRTIFEGKHGGVHNALLEGDFGAVGAMLRDPAQSDLLYGFESITRSDLRTAAVMPDYVYGGELVLDSLLRLAEAVGARHLANPEAGARRGRPVGADEIVDALEAFFGFELEVPNLFRREFGIASKRGVISYRVPQALFQAWQISRLVSNVPNPRVLEIGGGLGRTAFYARKFGVRDYTIVDIPITSLAQGYFLGRTLGEDDVLLLGEPAGERASRVALLPPSAFLDGDLRYDLVVNVDSLTEMDRDTARAYMKAIRGRAGAFLSINHEANPFTVHDLAVEAGMGDGLERTPYWLRPGYVQEVWRFAPAPSGSRIQE